MNESANSFSIHIIIFQAAQPQPYSFGYDTVDENGTKVFHNEIGDSNNVKKGSYGYSAANGLYRRVNYVADENGYRATVETNEPGTQSGNSADAVFDAKPVVTGPGVAAASSSRETSYAKGSDAANKYGQSGWNL